MFKYHVAYNLADNYSLRDMADRSDLTKLGTSFLILLNLTVLNFTLQRKNCMSERDREFEAAEQRAEKWEQKLVAVCEL